MRVVTGTSLLALSLPRGSEASLAPSGGLSEGGGSSGGCVEGEDVRSASKEKRGSVGLGLGLG